MIQERSVVAGILGTVCAIAVLGLIGLSQSGSIAGLALVNQVAASSSTQGQSSQGLYPSASSNTSNMHEAQIPGPSSTQSIESPNAMFGVAILGAISLAVGLGAAFVVSRRAG